VSDRPRQAGADIVHLCRNTGPEIAITAAVHAPADPRPPMSAAYFGLKCDTGLSPKSANRRHDGRLTAMHRYPTLGCCSGPCAVSLTGC
jgi:hypothetical protein